MKKGITLLLALLLAACSAPAQEGTIEAAGEPAVAPEQPCVAPAHVEPTWGEDVSKVNRLRAEWTVDDQFTPDEIEAILVAGDNWSTVTKGRVKLSFIVGHVTSETLWTIARENMGDATGRSRISFDGAYIKLDGDDFKGATCIGQFWHAAAHEFGHTLGIYGHGPSGVMQTGVSSCNTTFTHSDIDMFNEANPP